MSNIIQKEIDKREKERKLRFISLKKLEGTEAEAAKKKRKEFFEQKKSQLKAFNERRRVGASTRRIRAQKELKEKLVVEELKAKIRRQQSMSPRPGRLQGFANVLGGTSSPVSSRPVQQRKKKRGSKKRKKSFRQTRRPVRREPIRRDILEELGKIGGL